MRGAIIVLALALSACGGEGRQATEEEQAAAFEYGARCMSRGFTYEACRQLCADEYRSDWKWGATEKCQSAARKKLIERGPQ